jgi:hypothetical protein
MLHIVVFLVVCTFEEAVFSARGKLFNTKSEEEEEKVREKEKN